MQENLVICPECGSKDVIKSDAGFPIFEMSGTSYFCKNCRAVFKRTSVS